MHYPGKWDVEVQFFQQLTARGGQIGLPLLNTTTEWRPSFVRSVPVVL